MKRTWAGVRKEWADKFAVLRNVAAHLVRMQGYQNIHYSIGSKLKQGKCFM